jgi:drug/metabolite transporter (DMT)-like permease
MSFQLSLLTLLCVTCISVGQLLFKKAAEALPEIPTLLNWGTNIWLLASLVLYGLTTIGWIWILRHAPLHLAYPFMGLAFLIVPTLAWLFLGEPIGWHTLAGGTLILAGVALASQGG